MKSLPKYLKALKYFIPYTLILLGLYFYSMSTGWMWINATCTDREHGSNGSSHSRGSSGTRHYYHK